MLDKNKKPSEADIENFTGPKSYKIIQRMETALKEKYDLKKELRFPFGNSYGWGYKYSHKTKHLFYLFFEKNSLTATTQIGDANVKKLKEILPSLPAKAQTVWQNRYPCGKEGGWIHYPLTNSSDLNVFIKILSVRYNPKNKI